MSKTRLEAYTDAVIAILITLMVLNIQPPEQATTFMGLKPIYFSVLVYIMSFVVLATFWNNMHNVFQNVETISSRVLWSNNLFLLAISFIPFVTKWVSEHFMSRDPQLLYGFIIFIADIAYYLVVRELIRNNSGANKQGLLDHHRSKKMQITMIVNVIALLLGFVYPPLVSIVNSILIVIVWLKPDRQLESNVDLID